MKNGITGIVLCDFIPDLSDFEDTKGMWEDAQEAIDLVEKETGKRLPLSILYTTRGDIKGITLILQRPPSGSLENEIQSWSRTVQRSALSLGSMVFLRETARMMLYDLNMQRVRQNIRSVYERELPKLRKGVTEFSLSMNEFNNHPDSRNCLPWSA